MSAPCSVAVAAGENVYCYALAVRLSKAIMAVRVRLDPHDACHTNSLRTIHW